MLLLDQFSYPVSCTIYCKGIHWPLPRDESRTLWTGVAGTPLSAMCDLLRRALSFERSCLAWPGKTGELAWFQWDWDCWLWASRCRSWSSGSRDRKASLAEHLMAAADAAPFHLRLIAVDVAAARRLCCWGLWKALKELLWFGQVKYIFVTGAVRSE